MSIIYQDISLTGKLSLYITISHTNVSEQAADSAEDDWIMMNSRLPAVTLRLLANCMEHTRIQIYVTTIFQHTELNVDRIMMNDGPETVLQSQLSTQVSASVRRPSSLLLTVQKQPTSQILMSICFAHKNWCQSQEPLVQGFLSIHAQGSLPVNTVGYRQTKLLIALGLDKLNGRRSGVQNRQ